MEYILKDISSENIRNIIGVNDCNLNLLEELYGCGIVFHDNYFKLLSDDYSTFNKFSKHMDFIIKQSTVSVIDHDLIKQSFININNDINENYLDTIIATSFSGKPFKCKTYNQYSFIKEVKNNDLVFSIGPAGTGKTFLAVMLAVNYLKKGEVKKIIITRPAVEAGESLGFLPGDLKEKINPYLMPIYDALDSILGIELKEKYLEKGIIEVMPLAYMRGRTLDEAFIILDEAQNTTDKQMLMFLTRLGFNSKMIVNGDITQIDLNTSKNTSGLVCAMNKLRNIEHIGFVEFNSNDIARNPLVSKIIERYEI